MRMRLGLVAFSVVLASAFVVQAAGFTEDFESGLTNWIVLDQNPNAPPTDAAPVDPTGLSLHIQEGATQRISRSFDLSTEPQICLEYDFYQNSTIGTQRWFGGFAQNAAAPLANSALVRLGAINQTTYRINYWTTNLQNFDTGVPHAEGWHHVKLTLNFLLGNIHWELDGASGDIPNALLAVPDAVVLGYNFSNGAVGGADTSVWYDNVTVSACGLIPTPPEITNAVSTKTHGPQGDFSIDLWESGTSTGIVEDREGGPTTVTVTFDKDIERVTNTIADVLVTSGTINALGVSGNTLTVNLSGVTNGTAVFMTFPGIATAGSLASVNLQSLCIRSLIGDSNNDASTNIFDIVIIRNVINTIPDGSTFRNDVNVDGTINIFDLVVVRNNVNTSVIGGCLIVTAN